MPEDVRWAEIGPGSDPRKVLCRCSCGTEREVNKKNLRSGGSKSCGCHRRDVSARLGRANKGRKLKHGRVGTPEYSAWSKMKHRCHSQKSSSYDDYGGRGITVCARFRSFPEFYKDMGPRPSPAHSIDRIDNDGGYWCGRPECPECGPLGREPNCRWATQYEQQRNRRNTHNVTYLGRTQCLTDWAAETGIPGNVLERRLHMGWDVGRTMTEPVHRTDLTPEQVTEIKHRYDKGSRKHGGPALAAEFVVSYQTIIRIARGGIARYQSDATNH